MEPEHLDPALRGRGDEAAGKVGRNGPRPDQEAASQRHRQRGLRTLVERPDPLPRALDTPPHGGVEDASAGDLEVGEPRAVEDLRQLQEIGGGHRPRERLLPKQPDRGVHQHRHARSVAPLAL